ncbi:MAG: DUF4357 domain-containing protein [Candidatus Competibacteraceae bacterium]|nr:DUF4357 domain-containing protein [Candidatus Competibacteraceae bacterium]
MYAGQTLDVCRSLQLEVTREVLFTSPSAAAAFVAGCSVNGPLEWQVQGKGISLKQWKEQQ